jgi:hypothetical protein
MQQRINAAVNGQYGGDYSAYLQDHPEDNYYATALRNSKIWSDLDKYGQYAPKSLEGINQGLANKRTELENQAQELQNSYLPETLKLQVDDLVNKVKAGSLDYDTALAQLDGIKKNNAWIDRTNEQKIKESNYDISKAYYSPNSGGTTLKATSYKTDPQFAEEVNAVLNIMKNGQIVDNQGHRSHDALSEVQKNAEDLVNTYGYDGYNQLVALATPKGQPVTTTTVDQDGYTTSKTVTKK